MAATWYPSFLCSLCVAEDDSAHNSSNCTSTDSATTTLPLYTSVNGSRVSPTTLSSPSRTVRDGGHPSVSSTPLNPPSFVSPRSPRSVSGGVVEISVQNAAVTSNSQFNDIPANAPRAAEPTPRYRSPSHTPRRSSTTGRRTLTRHSIPPTHHPTPR